MSLKVCVFLALAGLTLHLPGVEGEESTPAASTDQKPLLIGLVTGDRVNLRATQSLSSEILLQFPKGAKILILNKEGPWYSTPLPPEVSVYVDRAFLRMEAGKATVQGSRVHVRAGPGGAFTSLGFLSEGEPLQVRQTTGEWAQVQAPSFCRGWVSESFITLLKPDQTLYPLKESSDGDH